VPAPGGGAQMRGNWEHRRGEPLPDDSETRGVDAVGFGVITLRRPSHGAAAYLRRVEEVRTPLCGPLGGHLEACLAAQDWVAWTCRHG
jgi:hypothetical protein